ncbi:MAG: hypothetical protein M9933_18650 [Chitinophagaceae bacterium]|nr:hypothetical protein [Chitinophagaceae bacterium]
MDIKSGMFGKVSLSKTKQEKGILIPSSAILNNEGKTQVYIIENNKAKLQTITTSKNIGDKTIVINGLKEGDVIVTNGFINLFDNANVLIN